MLQIAFILLLARLLTHGVSDLHALAAPFAHSQTPLDMFQRFQQLDYISRCGLLLLALFVLATASELFKALATIARRWLRNRRARGGPDDS